MKQLGSLALSLVVALGIAGAAPQWTARYGSPGGDVVPVAVAFDSLRGVCVGATAPGSGGGDFLVLRYDSLGHLAWSDTIDGPAAGLDEACGLAVGRAGRVFIAGTVTGPSGTDIGTACWSAAGTELWRAVFNGDSGGDDRAVAVVPDQDGGCYVAGSAWSGASRLTDIVALRYDSTGRLLWKGFYNGIARDEDSAVALVPDWNGGCIVVGQSVGADDSLWGVFLAFLPDGRQGWFDLRRAGRTFRPRAAHVDHGGNFYVTGSADFESTTDWDCYTLKFSRTHSYAWGVRYNSQGSPPDHGLRVTTGLDTMVHVAMLSFPGNTVNTVLRIQPLGSILDWTPRPLTDDSTWLPVAVLTTRDQGFIAAGSRAGTTAGLDCFATGYDSTPFQRWDATYRGPAGDDVLADCTADGLDRIAITAVSAGTSGSREIATIVWPPTGPGVAESPPAGRPDAGPSHARLVRAGTDLVVTLPAGNWNALHVIDAAGRTALSRTLSGAVTRLELGTARLTPGVYFLRLAGRDAVVRTSTLTVVR